MAARKISRRKLLGNSLKAVAAAAVAPRVALGAAISSSRPPTETQMKTIVVGEGKYKGLTNAAIQQAVDDAAAGGGGKVIVPPGVYVMSDALHLRSGVHVAGEKDVVLQNAPSVESKIADYLGYGHYEFTVEEPDKFKVGMGVHILDDKAGGFYTTVATIVGRQGDLLFINRFLNHDYHFKDNARAVSVFPTVEGEGVQDASIRNVTIDGNSAKQSHVLNGCRGGGVFLIRSSRVSVREVEVRQYHGDGVSFQQCTDISVERCHVHNNTGIGLHPGSGTVRYVLQDNRVHHNGSHGVYYCLRTTHSICRRNDIQDNGRNGISIGERDTDHLIEGNTIAGNSLEGIAFRAPSRRGGDRVLIVGNTIGPNCAKEGKCEISIPAGLRDIHILDNRFEPGATVPLSVAKGCRNVTFSGNTVRGREGGADVEGASDQVSRDRPKDLPAVGPTALPLEGGRHLSIDKLRPWEG